MDTYELEKLLQEHEYLMYDIALHPRRKVTAQFDDRVRFLVWSVTRHVCYIPTRFSVFKNVKDLALKELGYYPDYSKKQKELLEVLDYCCMYPQPYTPMDYD